MLAVAGCSRSDDLRPVGVGSGLTVQSDGVQRVADDSAGFGLHAHIHLHAFQAVHIGKLQPVGQGHGVAGGGQRLYRHLAGRVAIHQILTHNRSIRICQDSDPVQHAHFTVEELLHACLGVLGDVQPILTLPQVIDRGGMAYHRVVHGSFEERHMVLAHGGEYLVDQRGSQKIAGIRIGTQLLTGGDGRHGSILGNSVSVDHVGSSGQGVTDQHLMGGGGRFSHLLHAGKDNGVLCPHFQNVRHSNIGAVLSHIGLDCLHAQLLPDGDYTFLQLVALLEAVDLSEFNHLAVVSRQGLALAELSVHQLRAVSVQQVRVVEFLHFRSQVVVLAHGAGFTGDGVYVIAALHAAVHDVHHVRSGEELQVQPFFIIQKAKHIRVPFPLKSGNYL